MVNNLSLNDLPVFITDRTDDELMILAYHGLLRQDNDEIGEIGQRILIDQLPSFLNKLDGIYNTRILSCYIISPTKIYRVDRHDDLVQPSTLQSFNWKHPLIQLFGIRNQDKIKDSDLQEKYNQFIARYTDFKEIVTTQDYTVFREYFEDPGFDIIVNDDPGEFITDDTDLTSIHPVYRAHIVYLRLTPEQNYQMFSDEVMDIIYYNYSDLELTFMFYLNYKLYFNETGNTFHHVGDLLNLIVFYHYVSQPIMDLNYSLELLSKAINIELQNFYPSINLSNYLNSISTVLHADVTRSSDRKNHIFLNYQKLANIVTRWSDMQNMQEIPQAIVKRTLGVIHNLILTINAGHSVPLLFQNIISYDNVNRTLRQLLDLCDENELDLKVRLQILIICDTIEFDPSRSSFTSIDEMISAMITHRIDLNLEHWTVARDLLYTYNLIQIYRIYLWKTRNDPDQLLHNVDLSKVILNKLQEVYNQIAEDDLESIHHDFPDFEIFENMVDITRILFTDKHPDSVIREIISYLNEVQEKQDRILRFLGKRIIVFIADHFHDIQPQSILDFLQLYRKDNNYHLTLELLLDHLLRHLLDDREMTKNDRVYLKEYLDLDPDLVDDPTDEGIADLIFSLSQIEEAPKVQIRREDGTMMELEFSQTSEDKEVPPEDNSEPPTYIVTEIFDLIDDEDDLMNYLKLFYQYYKIKQDLDRDDPEIKTLYDELRQIDPERKLLDRYLPRITKLRRSGIPVIDDIQLEFLKCRLLIRGYPTFVLSRLDVMEELVQDRELPLSDWQQILELRIEVLMKLDMTASIPEFKVKQQLLTYYSRELNVSISEYLSYLSDITPEFYRIIHEHSSLSELVTSIIAYGNDELHKYVAEIVDPVIEVLVMIQLSWNKVEELIYLTEEYSNFDTDLKAELSRSSRIGDGFVVDLQMLQARIKQLSSEIDGLVGR